LSDFIPVNVPDLTGNEKEYLRQCIDTGWISSDGPFVRRLEEKMAERVGRKHGIAVSNGSLALDAAFAALDLAPGSEVILPSFTIISCATAIVRAGCVPVAVDVDPLTWNMDLASVEESITPRTRAILAVHIYGLCADMEALGELAARHGILIVEDAAEAHGLTCRDRPCGSYGHASTFSFYANKHVTCGEGGMILTDDDEFAGRCRSIRNLCFTPDRRFVHEDIGWNYRLSNLQAAVGCAQVERLDEFLERKRQMGARYRAALAKLTCLVLAPAATQWCNNNYWVFGVVLNPQVPFDAQEVCRRLRARQVDTRPFFYPIHRQPALMRLGLFSQARCPVSENLAQRGFYLPSGLGTSPLHVDRAAQALIEVLS
jgi:perosamine synthetase